MLLFYLFFSALWKNKRLEQRINDYIPVSKEKVVEAERNKGKQGNSLITAGSKLFKGVRFNPKTERELEQAGMSLKVEEFFAIKLFVSFGLVLFTLVLGFHWLFIGVTYFIGLFLPNLYVKSKRKKRLSLLAPQLVEALGSMSNSMRAGFSFLQAMQLIGKEMPDPVGPEFERVVREVGLGIPLEEVLEDLLERMPNKELEVMIQAIIAQRKSGGNLAELLETMEETIRGRIRIQEELKTLTSQGKMSSWVITLIPVALALYLYVVSPDYFQPMVQHPLGIAMLVVGAISIFIGWFFIQKIIRIEV